MTTAQLPIKRKTPAVEPGPFRFTREQYHHLGEQGYFEGKRVELIRGEIFAMSPLSWPHVASVRKTQDVLTGLFAGLGWVNAQSPVATEDSEPEPDVAVYRGQFLDYFDHPTPADTLLIVEVAVTSFVKDTTIKAVFYAEVGIVDYWVLDVDARRLLVFREPTTAGYQSRIEFTEADSVSPLAAPNASILVREMLP